MPPAPAKAPAHPLSEPVPRLKTNGAWIVHWGGKDHYLSKNEIVAKNLWSDPASLHPGCRTRWLRWRAARGLALVVTKASHTSRSSTPGHRGPLLLVDVARRLLESYESLGRHQAAAYFSGHLARFLNLHGETPLLSLALAAAERGIYQPPAVPLLDAFKRDLLRMPKESRYGARTINHDLTAVKRLFNFAAEQGLCPAINWRAVRRVSVSAPAPEELTPDQLFKVMREAHASDPHLVPYLALNYLTLARPSEVVELICSAHDPATWKAQGRHRRKPPSPRDPALNGRFLPIIDELGHTIAPRGLFALQRHKNTWRSAGEAPPMRYLILTDQALAWLDHATPIWSSLDGYSAACRRAVRSVSRFGPRMLRDSGASHLRARGVVLADIQTLLGHVQDGEWPSYVREAWPLLRGSAGRISV